MDWEYDFTVTNVPRHTAELIMQTVTALVESAGGQIGGGFVESKDEEADDEKDA